jgi:hypothetical protein
VKIFYLYKNPNLSYTRFTTVPNHANLRKTLNLTVFSVLQG